MKQIWLVSLLISFFSVAAFSGNAQSVIDPTTWTYEAKRISNTEFDLIFHAELEEGWHIFSQKPGDEYLIPPKFNFVSAKNYKLTGAVNELGTLLEEKLEIAEKPIRYYERSVDFVQRIVVRGDIKKVSGHHEYQVCNDRLCLPPRTKDFTFQLR